MRVKNLDLISELSKLEDVSGEQIPLASTNRNILLGSNFDSKDGNLGGWNRIGSQDDFLGEKLTFTKEHAASKLFEEVKQAKPELPRGGIAPPQTG